jgi:hypothetical protein
MKKEVQKTTQTVKKVIKPAVKPVATKSIAKKVAVAPVKKAEKVIIAVPKKTAAVKTVVVKKPKFVVAPEDQRFWVNNGPVLKDLEELYNALLKMSKEQFLYHTKNKNDFSLWVEIVLLDKKTAAELKKTKTQKDAAKVVADALKK